MNPGHADRVLAALMSGDPAMPLQAAPLLRGGGAAISATMTEVTQNELDAKLATVGAQTDTKFVELSRQIDTKFAGLDLKFAQLEGRLSGLPSRWEMFGGLLALFVAVLAVLAFGGDRLALGLGQADARQQQLQRDAAQDAAMKATDRQFGELLRRIPAKQ